MSADPYRIFPPATKPQRRELRRSIKVIGLNEGSIVVDDKTMAMTFGIAALSWERIGSKEPACFTAA
jgi:hypothetical protein